MSENLKGGDLWAFLCQPKAAKAPALTNAEKRRRKKEQARKAFEETKALLHEACEAMTLWRPVARVLVVYSVTCHCGRTHSQPELHLSDKPLVRLRHLRTGAEKTTRLSWAETPISLPKEVVYLPAKSTHCAECLGLQIEAPGILSQAEQLQLPLEN